MRVEQKPANSFWKCFFPFLNRAPLPKWSFPSSLITLCWFYPPLLTYFYTEPVPWAKRKGLLFSVLRTAHRLCLPFLHPHLVQVDYSTWTQRGTKILSLHTHCSLLTFPPILQSCASVHLPKALPWWETALKILCGKALIPSCLSGPGGSGWWPMEQWHDPGSTAALWMLSKDKCAPPAEMPSADCTSPAETSFFPGFLYILNEWGVWCGDEEQKEWGRRMRAFSNSKAY